MKTADEAIKYLELGWSVIPVQPGKKKPKIPWTQFQTRRMSHNEARSLFADGDNIGLVCGDISGVLAVDLDTYKEVSGTR